MLLSINSICFSSLVFEIKYTLSQLSAVLLVADVRYPGMLQFAPGFENTENPAKETEETKIIENDSSVPDDDLEESIYEKQINSQNQNILEIEQDETLISKIVS